MKEYTEASFREFCGRRKEAGFGTAEEIKSMSEIVDNVRNLGDSALIRYTRDFDRVTLTVSELRVSPEEIERAYSLVSKQFLKALEQARMRIEEFHRPQKQKSWFQTESDGSVLGQLFRPIESVGIYVPGGTAVYPSSVLMNTIPARIAGVENIIMCTPPSPSLDRGRGPSPCGEVSPNVLVAADMVGVNAIYKIGGAQAIAALAFGTDTVPSVDKIVGPGNVYVTLAKKLVYGHVDIDMLAGPSEILVVADESARADFVAADLLSQAEHDPNAGCVLISTSQELLLAVRAEVEKQVRQLPRAKMATSALLQNGALVWVQTLEKAMELANLYAPEHLEIMTIDPFPLLGQVRNAGAVFLGPNSPEAMGDYVAGSNHVLPTGGTARFASGLTVSSFMKSSSLTMLSREKLEELSTTAMTFAGVEGLEAHGAAVRIRLGGE